MLLFALIINSCECNELLVSLIVTGIISSLTIGGKAIGKGIAINKSKEIVTMVSKTLSIFQFKK